MKGLSLCSGNTIYLNLPTPSKERNDSQNGNGNFAVLVNFFDLYIFSFSFLRFQWIFPINVYKSREGSDKSYAEKESSIAMLRMQHMCKYS
jgi:hypothetical protein